MTVRLPEWARRYDEVAWKEGYGPGDVFGVCQHSCQHKRTVKVADGPDARRAALVRCDDAPCTTVSSIQCRRWISVQSIPWGPVRAVYISPENR